MKKSERINGKCQTTVKCCGLTVMSQTTDYLTASVERRFLGGIFKTVRLHDVRANTYSLDWQIAGFSLIKRLEKANDCHYYLFKQKIYSRDLKAQFKKRYFPFLDKRYDDIYILSAHSGEVYLTLAYVIRLLIKRNGSKNPLLIATLPYHVDLIRLLCADLPYLYLRKIRLNFVEDSFQMWPFRFFLLFKANYFKQVEYDIKYYPPGKSHYFSAILKQLNFTVERLTLNKMVVPFTVEQALLVKMEQMGLKLERFVFVAPEANSCEAYSKDFWEQLIQKCQQKGYDVFFNVTNRGKQLLYQAHYKTCPLNFTEVFALAKRAKRIVALRSGINELLLQTEVPMDILYTKFRNHHYFNSMDVKRVISGFGFREIPLVDQQKIREFNTESISPQQCLALILQDL